MQMHRGPGGAETGTYRSVQRASGLHEQVRRGVAPHREGARDGERASGRPHGPECAPINIINFLRGCYLPSTAFQIAATIHSLPECQHWKENARWKHAFNKTLCLDKNASPAKQAKPPEAYVMESIVKARPSYPCTIVAAFLWISASRYGDLKWARTLHVERMPSAEGPMILALLDFRGTKGDTNGSRGDTKAIFMPEHWLPTIEEQFTRLRAENEAREKGVMVTANNKSVRAFPGLLSEHMIRKTLSQTDPELTLHSARRGACHTLLKIFPLKQIARLALCAQNDRKKVATTALCTHGAWFQEEREQDQMRMDLLG